MSDTSPISRGWVNEPDGRGTWGILSTCILTTILCCWTTVIPNLPAQCDGRFQRWRYKLELAMLTLLGSEFILMLSAGQWTSARRSVKDFHEAGYEGWTMKHAFFADMGGFLVKPLEHDLPPFPLNSNQLFKLVKDGYLQYPNLEEEEIEDRNKLDELTRWLAIAQTLWFALNCIFRFAQGLFVTTIELTTLSFIIAFLITSYFWYHKPMGITTPFTLELHTSIAAIRHDHQVTGLKWYQTPFDYLSRKEGLYARTWRYYHQILRSLHIPLLTWPKRRPYERIPAINWLNWDVKAEIIAAPTMAAFSVLFFVAWNDDFPTASEKILWRVACVNAIALPPVARPMEYLQRTRPREDRGQKRESTWIGRLASKLRNIDPEQDPHLEVSLRAFIPLTLLCAMYCVGRGFLLIEDVIGLRSLPDSAFQTVSWSRYVPHL